jgi:TonB family protein
MLTFLRDHFWQTTLFTVVIWSLALILGNRSARLRYVLWATAGVKFAVPAVFVAFLAVQFGFNPAWMYSPEPAVQPESAAVTVTIETAESVVVQPEPVQPSRLPVFLFGGLWLFGSAALGALWLKRLNAVALVVRSGERVTDGREARVLAGVLARTGHASPVPLILCDGDLEPGAWGIVRPVVVLPRSLAKLLTDEELEAIFLHELTHIVRRDNLFAVAQTLLRCVWWFHPLVWLVDRRLSEERELICDEAVLYLGGRPEAYVAAMYKVCRAGLGLHPVAGVSMLTGPNLQKRIKTMMKFRFSSPTRLSLITTVSALGLIAFSTAAGMDRDWIQDSRAIIPVPPPVPAPQTPKAPPPPPKPATAPTGAPQTPPTPPAPPSADMPAAPPVLVIDPTFPVPPAAPTPPDPIATPADMVAPAGIVAPLAATSPLATPAPAAAPTPHAWAYGPARAFGIGTSSGSGTSSGMGASAGGGLSTTAPRAVTASGSADTPRYAASPLRKPAIRVVKYVHPKYPESARKQGITGLVRVDVVIDKDGKVVEARAVDGPEALRSASVEAAKKCRFEKTGTNAKVTLAFDFAMYDNPPAAASDDVQ